jgi:Ca2+-binding RTX toxin-like protein
LGGGEGDDVLLGNDGNDTMTGADGDDRLFGGAGDDVATIWPEGGSDEVFLGDGADTLDGSAARLGFLGRGGADDDVLVGGAGVDTLFGDGGADALFGQAGADVLDGGAGADSMDGGAGNDSLTGGDGADTLLGGAGDDLVLAGAGDAVALGADADRVQVLAERASLADWAGVEVAVADYEPGLDRIVVQVTGFADLAHLSLRFDEVGGGVRVVLVDADPDASSETGLMQLDGISLARLLPADFQLAAA